MGVYDDVAVNHQGESSWSPATTLRHWSPSHRGGEPITSSGVDQRSCIPKGWCQWWGLLDVGCIYLLTTTFQGSTNNFTHPALESLVMDFFYAPSSVGSVFLEVFSRKVPTVAVCLVATVVCFSFFISTTLMSFTASCCPQRVHSNWCLARLPVWIWDLLKGFCWFLGHAASNRPRFKARCENTGIASCLGVRWQVWNAHHDRVLASTNPKVRTKTQSQPVVPFSDEFYVILD